MIILYRGFTEGYGPAVPLHNLKLSGYESKLACLEKLNTKIPPSPVTTSIAAIEQLQIYEAHDAKNGTVGKCHMGHVVPAVSNFNYQNMINIMGRGKNMQ